MTIPLAVRVGFTLWMVFWVSVVILNQGPRNFLWLCNLAQFVLLYAIWSGNRLILSSQAGLVTLVGLGWGLDFVAALVLGGRSPTGFTAYMFGEELPLIARAVSFYHVGLPVLVLWLIGRGGYDRRGPWVQSGIGALGVLGTWRFTDPERNVNWFYELFGREQVWFPEPLFAGILMVSFPLVLYFPGHGLVLGYLRLVRSRRRLG